MARRRIAERTGNICNLRLCFQKKRYCPFASGTLDQVSIRPTLALESPLQCARAETQNLGRSGMGQLGKCIYIVR
jgi:hypothetical protein